MDYEKIHKEAVEVARQLVSEGKVCSEYAERMFPELKESEDERVRKTLVRFHKSTVDIDGIKGEDIVAWLEKKKPVKTPQWMIDFLDEHRRNFGNPMDYDERRDVDGKLLCIKEWLEGNYVEQKHADNVEHKFKIGKSFKHRLSPEIYTVTEYIDNGIAYTDKYGERYTKYYDDEDDWEDYELVEQKPAEWSEADENTINNICDFIQGHTNFAEEAKEDAVRFLKSLKDRVQSQPKQEWSEEDTVAIECAVDFLNKEGLTSLAASLERLKSLIPQNHWKPSEEQMKTLNEVINYCANRKEAYLNDYIYNRLIDLRDELNKL